MTITKGYTFGSTEQVTNTKIHSIVDSASIALDIGELKTGFLSSLTTVVGIVRPINIYSITAVATNATVPSAANKTYLRMYWSTYGSITSISGMTSGQFITISAQQASFPVICDVGNFVLSAKWTPNGANSNITLIWDGTKYIETSRTSVA